MFFVAIELELYDLASQQGHPQFVHNWTMDNFPQDF